MMIGGVFLIFLGIDGGGTSTEFIIIDENGKILGHTTKATCHYKQTSLQNFKEIIIDGVNEVCRKADTTISQIDYSFIGIPGYGEILDDVEKMDLIINDIFKQNSFECANDAVAAWAGSLACKPGINIVAGTGAIGFGMNKNGKLHRAGGWGYFCGDEGSAYWLGKKAIEIFSKEADGRLEQTQLYDIFKSKLNIQNDFDLIDLIYTTYEMKRDKIAELAIILHEAAEVGDKFAIDAFSQSAYEHYLTIKALIEKLDFLSEEKVLVSYSGGVFNSGRYILEPLKSYLDNLNINIELINPILTPVAGAALYAYKIFTREDNLKIVETLLEEEVKWRIRY